MIRTLYLLELKKNEKKNILPRQTETYERTVSKAT